MKGIPRRSSCGREEANANYLRQKRPGFSTGHEAGPHLLGVLGGGIAVEPLELPAELRRALVSDRPRGRARVVSLVGHEPLGVVEPDSLQVLERRARRHELEIMMEG